MASLKYCSGSYVGDGNDNRDIGGFYITTFGFMLLTRGDNWIIRHAGMAGDTSFNLVGGPATNKIKSVTPGTSFRVGTDTFVNLNGTTYQWIAFADDTSFFRYGSYVGNGIDNRVISCAGITPSAVIIIEAGSGQYTGVWRPASLAGDSTLVFAGSGGAISDSIQSFAVDQFTVGTLFPVNENGKTYYWLAFGTDTSKFNTGVYVGDNNDNRNITITPNIFPVLAWMRRVSTANDRLHVARWNPMGGDTTTQISSGYMGDAIQAFQATGFQVGADYVVNGNDGGGGGVNSYYWAAITADLQDPDPTAGYSKALPDACGHSLMVNPLPQL